ncbi:UXS1 [Lepeophtheirus salmonis]|nr:UXS1 [Lepeophtheirus salmonis]CAF2792874.1 UXS1 [Lepeophtheirus salmonis]
MNDGRVVSNFILQALKDEPITIYGDGEQTRSFQYVQDLVEGLVLLMNSNYTKPVNIGNPNERTIKQFAELIRKKVGSKSKIDYLPAVEDDPQRRRPDISLAKRVLEWKPVVMFEDGIQKTIEYFRNELSRSHHLDRNIPHPDTYTVTYSS